MDFWDHPYYKPVKFCTSIIGLWPHQPRHQMIIYRTVLFSMVTLQLTSRVWSMIHFRYDTKVLLDSLSPLIVDLIFVVKLGNNIYYFEEVKYLLEKIRENWNIFPANNGMQWLHYHSDFARKISILYLGGMYICCTMFTTEPLQERLILPMIGLVEGNATIPKRFPTPVYLGPVDLETYYYPVFVFSSFCTFVIINVVSSVDVLLFTLAEHACGLFKGLGYAIENLPAQSHDETFDEGFYYLRNCILIHKRTILFSELISTIYLWNFFAVVGLNMILLSVTGVQVMVNIDSMEKVVKYVMFVMMEVFHLFIECQSAQRLMDASFELKETLTNAKWYVASRRTHKLILLMLMRCQSPIVLTAGKIIVMNLDTYAAVLKTAASYFTIFLAMQ